MFIGLVEMPVFEDLIRELLLHYLAGVEGKQEREGFGHLKRLIF